MNRRVLKIIALVTMTIDHIGMIFFPYSDIYRIIGRISFPIFAYFVAESCRYTSDRKKYMLSMIICEAVCLLGYYIGMGEIYFSVMMTFILSVILINAYDFLAKMLQKGVWHGISGFMSFVIVFFVMNRLCDSLDIMYGFWGVLLPLWVYIFPDRYIGLLFFSVGLYILGKESASMQIYALLAVPFLFIYDGKKIKSSKFEKYFYYIYYPVHLGVLYLIERSGLFF